MRNKKIVRHISMPNDIIIFSKSIFCHIICSIVFEIYGKKILLDLEGSSEGCYAASIMLMLRWCCKILLLVFFFHKKYFTGGYFREWYVNDHTIYFLSGKWAPILNMGASCDKISLNFQRNVCAGKSRGRACRASNGQIW